MKSPANTDLKWQNYVNKNYCSNLFLGFVACISWEFKSCIFFSAATEKRWSLHWFVLRIIRKLGLNKSVKDDRTEKLNTKINGVDVWIQSNLGFLRSVSLQRNVQTARDILNTELRKLFKSWLLKKHNTAIRQIRLSSNDRPFRSQFLLCYVLFLSSLTVCAMHAIRDGTIGPGIIDYRYFHQNIGLNTGIIRKLSTTGNRYFSPISVKILIAIQGPRACALLAGCKRERGKGKLKMAAGDDADIDQRP